MSFSDSWSCSMAFSDAADTERWGFRLPDSVFMFSSEPQYTTAMMSVVFLLLNTVLCQMYIDCLICLSNLSFWKRMQTPEMRWPHASHSPSTSIPSASKRFLSRIISSLSSLMILALASSLMTALHTICLALSAYLHDEECKSRICNSCVANCKHTGITFSAKGAFRHVLVSSTTVRTWGKTVLLRNFNTLVPKLAKN